MAIACDVRALDTQVEEAYRRLLPGQRELIERGKLQWKFDRHPAARGVLAVAHAASSIVGMIGFVPACLKLGCERVAGFQALDTVVDPGCRGQGVFVKLGQAFYSAAPELEAAAVFGFPNESAAPGWFGKLGWIRLGTPPFLIKPLRAGYFVRQVLGGARGLFDTLPLSVGGEPEGKDRAVRIRRFDARADTLWHAFSTNIACAVERTHDYLNWRLVDHPTAQYDTRGVFAADGEMRAFVTTHVAAKHDGVIGYVMEAMALPEAADDLVMLLRLAIAEMRAAGVDAILAWASPNAPNHRAYRRCRFLPLPDRIRPIHLYFGVRPFTAQARARMATDRDWYLSYLDSDTV
ncbi:MAG TPA: hypothetical protein VGD07_19655 [Methylomirabilota bacterium]